MRREVSKKRANLAMTFNCEAFFAATAAACAQF